MIATRGFDLFDVPQGTVAGPYKFIAADGEIIDGFIGYCGFGRWSFIEQSFLDGLKVRER